MIISFDFDDNNCLWLYRSPSVVPLWQFLKRVIGRKATPNLRFWPLPQPICLYRLSWQRHSQVKLFSNICSKSITFNYNKAFLAGFQFRVKPLAALTVSKYFYGQMLGKVFLLFQDSQIKIYITNSVFVGLRCMPLSHLKCRRSTRWSPIRILSIDHAHL